MKLAIISGVVSALSVAHLQAGEFQTIEFEHNNVTRTAEIYLPTDFDPTKPTDLVYAIHGFTMTGEDMMMAGDFDDAAEQFNVVVVAPSGIGDFPPDVPHFDSLKEKVDSLYMVDRAFGVGYSLGGAQVFDYAVSRPTVLAAVVSILGANPGAELTNAGTRVPFPAMMVAGTADVVLPFDGGSGAIGGFWPPVQDSVEAMIAQNQCASDPIVTAADAAEDMTTLESSQYTCAAYTSRDGTEKEFDFQFVKLSAAGHGYPGQKDPPVDDLLLPVSQEIGTPEFFKFLFQHDYRATIPGDFNHDTIIGIEDVDRLATEMIRSRPDLSFDLNADEDVSLADLDELLTLAGRKNGDSNFDGVVDFADFLTFAESFGKRGVAWSEGNFNGDRKSDFGDFLILSENFGTEAGTASQTIPEPSSFLLASLVCMALGTLRTSSGIGSASPR